MKTEIKQWIFFLLSLGVSVLLAVLVLKGLSCLFGNGELTDPKEGLVGYFFWTGLFFIPVAHVFNAIFSYFGIFPVEDLPNRK